MDISVVIPAKNEENNLTRLLGDLRQQSEQPKTIVVADARSTDSTAAIARRFAAKVVAGGYPATGRNNGAKAVRTEFILFLDADVRIPNKHFLRNALREVKRRRLDIAIVSNSPAWTGHETLMQRLWLRAAHVVMNNYIRAVSRTPLRCGIGTCMFVRASALETCGGFDTTILWGEDTELVERMAAKRFRFGMLRLSIAASTRRILDVGVVRFYRHVIQLQMYRYFKGEIRNWSIYRRITDRKNHFAFRNNL